MTRSLVLQAGLSAREVDTRVRRAHRIGDVSRRAVAFYLADLGDRGLHRELGFPSVVSYARAVLGMPRRTARELVRTGKALAELPGVEAAFQEGHLPWSRVRLLCRVAVPETEGQWLEAAGRCSQEELERMVRGRKVGDPPPKEGLPTARFRPAIEFDAAGWQMWCAACDKLRAEMGFGREVSDSELAYEMARMVVSSDVDGSVPGRKPVDGGPFRVVVAPSADGAEGGVVETDDGPEPIDEGALERVTEESRVPKRLRDKVLARDRRKCKHCESRRALHVHHVQWRSRGGATEAPNLVTVCAACHGLIHEGFLGVEVAQCATQGPEFSFTDKRGRTLALWPTADPDGEQATQAESQQPAAATSNPGLSSPFHRPGRPHPRSPRRGDSPPA